ncbi:glycosyltransferase [Candidatus Pacearchaeota archaeon]|nr:glycosyltransferase [Candidatus Pacearchaeota archaeon]
MISLCIITKNNQETIEKCINSVKSIIGEIILADTGSTDNTIKIAENFGAKIFHFKWNNNFSDAKNFAKSQATGNWILNLDADETIAEQDLEKIKNLAEITEFIGFSFIQRNYRNGIGLFSSISCTGDKYEESKVSSCFIPRRMIRFFRNLPEIGFEGAVHDSVEFSILKCGKIMETEIPIHHFGMLSRSNERTRMYIDIEKKNIKDDYFQYYQIGIQLHSINETDEALDFLSKSLDKNPDFYLAWLEKGIIFLEQGKIYEAEQALKMAEKKGSHEMIFSHLGIIYSILQNYSSSINYFLKALSINPKNADTHFNLGLTYKNTGNIEQAKKEFALAVYLNSVYKEKLKSLFQ